MESTRRVLISFFSLLILVTSTPNIAKAAYASADINANADTTNMRPSFPAHWGPPPGAQTRDLRRLPGEYGMGSGTLHDWILEKMAEDDARAVASSSTKSGVSDGALWPEKNLVGLTGDEAKMAVIAGNSELSAANIHILPHDAMVTMDYREDRVRIFVGDDGKVVRQPMIG